MSSFSPAPYSKIIRQFMQYVLVGGLAFVVDFTTLYALTQHAGLHYLVSASVGFALGLAVNYLLCIAWVFDHRAVQRRTHEFALFAGIGVAGLLLNNALLFALTEWADLHYLMSKIIAAAFILVFNFSLRRTLLFTRKHPPASSNLDATSNR